MITKYGSEKNLHEQVTQYLRLQYPNVLFHSDYGSGVRLTMGQAVSQRKIQKVRAWPDLFLAETRHVSEMKLVNGEIEPKVTIKHGLFLELKKEGTKLYLKDGVTMVANEHYREQVEVLRMLRERGYEAQFAVGLTQAIDIIDKYLK